MPKIFDASKGCVFTDRKIVFDTNVWIAIDGVDPRPETQAYSNFYKSALQNKNTIVTNDYIISEFFNRICKIQYDIVYADDPQKRKFKSRRKGAEFRAFMETIRDTCLNIIEDCEYEPAIDIHCDIKEYLTEVGSGKIDFSDIVIREYCLKRGYILVSHDADFEDCGLEFVTANPRLLAPRKRR